jgi:hypothetical protein
LADFRQFGDYFSDNVKPALVADALIQIKPALPMRRDVVAPCCGDGGNDVNDPNRSLAVPVCCTTRRSLNMIWSGRFLGRDDP